jgi:chitinase
VTITVPATVSNTTSASKEAQTTSSIKIANYKAKREESTALRPFGDASVDGFDLDIESTTQNFLPFAQRLRDLMDQHTAASEQGRKFIMAAAPQCPFPDAAVGDMLDSALKFDAVFVQFYNNYCGLPSFTSSTEKQATFNFEIWDHWAKTSSANKDVKVFLGVPAGPTAAGSGYTPLEKLQPIIEYSKGFGSFGGVMMWDATQAAANEGFLEGIKAALGKAPPKLRERSVRRKLAQSWRG